MSTSHGSTTMVLSMRVWGLGVLREPEGEFSGRLVGFDSLDHVGTLACLEGLCLKEDITDGLLLVKALKEGHYRWIVTSQGP
ncbi:hypothetical protein ACFX13_017278 [Malus domestica]